MKSNNVRITEEQLTEVVSESVKKAVVKCVNEGKLGDLLGGIGAVAKESRWYFENNKKWAKRANKICDAIDDLMMYVGEHLDDEA